MSAAESVREWRLRLGLSASALAALAKVNAGLISLHENGCRHLSPAAMREVMLVLQSVETIRQILPVRPDPRDVEGLRKILRRLWDGELGGYRRLHEEEVAARAGIAAAGEDEASGPRVIDTSYVPGTVLQNDSK